MAFSISYSEMTTFAPSRHRSVRERRGKRPKLQALHGRVMIGPFKIAPSQQDLSAAMLIVVVLVAGVLTKAGYSWWGAGIIADVILLAGGVELRRRNLRRELKKAQS
jgi:hypothetical protein